MSRIATLLFLAITTLVVPAGMAEDAVPPPAIPSDTVTPQPPAPVPAKKLDPDALLRMVMDRSPAGINRRLGPDAASYRIMTNKDKAKPAPAKSEAAKPESNKPVAFPEVWMAPKHKEGNHSWEIGGPWTAAAGDFSSAQGQVLYAGSDLGIDRVTVLEMTNNCFSESPEPPWWGGSHPEPHSKDWAASAAGGAVGIGRGISTWSNCGVIVFANGLVCTAGTVTAVGSNPMLRLPEGKLPTAVCVTSRNEFALITVVDIKSKPRKAQLAVVALAGCKPGFFHEWQVPHPGMPSVAMLSSMKLIGFIDLVGISIPTAVSAVGNYDGARLSDPKSGNIGSFRDYDLATEASRNGIRSYVSATGWAVVAACYEDKAVFIDLRPLFSYYRSMYCGSAESYQKTCDQGPGPKQWPCTFEAEPSQMPVVAEVVRVPEPTAVLAGLGNKEKARGYIACRDGRVAVFAVGGLATEGAPGGPGIVAVEAVQVGRNPVCLAYQRYTTDEVIAVSRGDRELAWIRTSASGSQVTRRLRDSRLIDPVYCEVAETHGIETAVVTVCDFSGQKIINYRFGELRFVTNGGARFGMGADGKDAFECGGFLELPGNPFAFCGANVN